MNMTRRGGPEWNAERKNGRPVERGGFRWTCPFCGKSRLNRTDGEEGRKNATAALRTHIMASGGDEHGPRNGFPTDDIPALAEHVTEAE